MKIDEALGILKEAGLSVEEQRRRGMRSIMAFRMAIWDRAFSLLTDANNILIKDGLESTIPFHNVYRFRKTEGDKVAQVDITIKTEGARFRFERAGFRYDDETKHFNDSTSEKIDRFQKPEDLVEYIEEMIDDAIEGL